MTYARAYPKAILLLLSLALAACQPAAEIVATQVASEVAAVVAETLTAVPTHTRQPTATPLPTQNAFNTATPLPTNTTQPSATPVDTPTPYPTFTPTATATPSPTAEPTATRAAVAAPPPAAPGGLELTNSMRAALDSLHSTLGTLLGQVLGAQLHCRTFVNAFDQVGASPTFDTSNSHQIVKDSYTQYRLAVATVVDDFDFVELKRNCVDKLANEGEEAFINRNLSFAVFADRVNEAFDALDRARVILGIG